jgi:hypothetical protein
MYIIVLTKLGVSVRIENTGRDTSKDRVEGRVLMILTIEKIEGPWAIIEWGKDVFQVPKYLLPGSARTGDEITIEIRMHGRGGRLRRRDSGGGSASQSNE